ncbi:uncharacterized protein LOC117284314 isoform X1 [Fukomys damarensis]|uniref:uncharacterized protein LOC117284314 isoform X1 n=1 Tax=Fukomys damarensis TaxID=885580 RepID=UPI001455CC3B|nr:uncharacterized protein LOC117284314 isoform X1 [Fukomys damarensis]
MPARHKNTGRKLQQIRTLSDTAKAGLICACTSGTGMSRKPTRARARASSAFPAAHIACWHRRRQGGRAGPAARPTAPLPGRASPPSGGCRVTDKPAVGNPTNVASLLPPPTKTQGQQAVSCQRRPESHLHQLCQATPRHTPPEGGAFVCFVHPQAAPVSHRSRGLWLSKLRLTKTAQIMQKQSIRQASLCVWKSFPVCPTLGKGTPSSPGPELQEARLQGGKASLAVLLQRRVSLCSPGWP